MESSRVSNKGNETLNDILTYIRSGKVATAISLLEESRVDLNFSTNNTLSSKDLLAVVGVLLINRKRFLLNYIWLLNPKLEKYFSGQSVRLVSSESQNCILNLAQAKAYLDLALHHESLIMSEVLWDHYPGLKDDILNLKDEKLLKWFEFLLLCRRAPIINEIWQKHSSLKNTLLFNLTEKQALQWFARILRSRTSKLIRSYWGSQSVLRNALLQLSKEKTLAWIRLILSDRNCIITLYLNTINDIALLEEAYKGITAEKLNKSRLSSTQRKLHALTTRINVLKDQQKNNAELCSLPPPINIKTSNKKRSRDTDDESRQPTRRRNRYFAINTVLAPTIMLYDINDPIPTLADLQGKKTFYLTEACGKALLGNTFNNVGAVLNIVKINKDIYCATITNEEVYSSFFRAEPLAGKETPGANREIIDLTGAEDVLDNNNNQIEHAMQIDCAVAATTEQLQFTDNLEEWDALLKNLEKSENRIPAPTHPAHARLLKDARFSLLFPPAKVASQVECSLSNMSTPNGPVGKKNI